MYVRPVRRRELLRLNTAVNPQSRSIVVQHSSSTVNLMRVCAHMILVRVKLGVDVRTGETVAVKIMYKDNMSARAAQQLRREITSMKALNHPNVLRLKDVHEVCIRTSRSFFCVGMTPRPCL